MGLHQGALVSFRYELAPGLLTEERPREDTVGRQPCARQGGRAQEKLDLLTP